jgi:hypothetical protein
VDERKLAQKGTNSHLHPKGILPAQPSTQLQNPIMNLIAAHEALQKFKEALPGKPAIGEATEAYRDSDEIAYAISRLPLGTRRAVKVIVCGAGFSGLAFAREVETEILKNVSLTVYEKNASVGGTWYENRYPGCASVSLHSLKPPLQFNLNFQ